MDSYDLAISGNADMKLDTPTVELLWDIARKLKLFISIQTKDEKDVSSTAPTYRIIEYNADGSVLSDRDVTSEVNELKKV